MMRKQPPKPRLSGNSGFTMVEVLVAFVVLATLTIAVQRGTAASLTSSMRAEERLGADLVARTLISAPMGTGPSALLPQRGSMNGYQWSVQFEPVELSLPTQNAVDGKAPAWRPVRMAIMVSAPSGTKLAIETIRLAGG